MTTFERSCKPFLQRRDLSLLGFLGAFTFFFVYFHSRSHSFSFVLIRSYSFSFVFICLRLFAFVCAIINGLTEHKASVADVFGGKARFWERGGRNSRTIFLMNARNFQTKQPKRRKKTLDIFNFSAIIKAYLTLRRRRFLSDFTLRPPSSSGLGRRILSPQTGVRFP